MSAQHEKSRLYGLAAGFGAFCMWGLLPVYWKALEGVPPLEIICHRIVWSVAFTALFLTFGRRWGEVRAVFANRRSMLILFASGIIIGLNWWLYVWAVNNNHVVDASLGYYINPLVNALLGLLFLGERLNRLKGAALALAALGVAVSIFAHGSLPWIALTLAFSFGVYGLARKTVGVPSLPGLFFETTLLALPGGAWLVWLAVQGTGALGHGGAAVDMLLVGAGLVTSLPLLLFAFSARRITLTTVGVLQYVGPTLMFLLGVFVYDEPFDVETLVTFLLIWAGVAVYMWDGILSMRRSRRAARMD